MSALDPKDWSAFWADGPVTTFGYGFNGNYDQQIKAFWHTQLDGLHGNLVDLCCGNGALVWLANDFLKRNEAVNNIYGVDLADIKPFKLLRKNPSENPRVKFIGNTAIDTLPFEDRSMQMAISQYGIEYADIPAAIAELDRVLAADGKMAFITHSDSSFVVQSAAGAAEKYRYLLGEGKFYETALELEQLFGLKKSHRDLASDPDYRRLIGRLNQASYHAHHMRPASGLSDPAMQEVIKHYISSLMSLYNGASPIKGKKRARALEEWRTKVVDTLARMEDLMSAALSEEALQGLVDAIGQQGFEVTLCEPVRYGPEQLFYGTAIVATRPGAV